MPRSKRGGAPRVGWLRSTVRHSRDRTAIVAKPKKLPSLPRRGGSPEALVGTDGVVLRFELILVDLNTSDLDH